MIHVTALVADDTAIADDVGIGPFCIIGADGDGGPVRFEGRATLRSHSVVYRGVVIGDGFQTGHGALVREATMIGAQVSIGSHTVVEHHVTIADGVRLHSRCFVPEFSVLEAGAWLGPGVIVTNARYPNRPDTKDNLEPVRVGAGAVIGAGSVLLPGVEVGAGALVGAGAVVVRSVAPGVRVVGNPGHSLDHRQETIDD